MNTKYWPQEDLHSKNKESVGERLCVAALRIDAFLKQQKDLTPNQLMFLHDLVTKVQNHANTADTNKETLTISSIASILREAISKQKDDQQQHGFFTQLRRPNRQWSQTISTIINVLSEALNYDLHQDVKPRGGNLSFYEPSGPDYPQVMTINLLGM